MLSERLNHTACVAQGCDGMCVQERFSAEVPQALTHIQWHTHHLSLVLVDCVRKVKPAGEFCFVVLQDMHTFFSSLFVNALVTEKQSELEQSQQSIRLEKHSDT